ncbi:MAG: TIGR04255 family protein [Desulfomonile tiedjei]|nr:TIGR04255 family protein [Desulfomonile tiedjei]
MGQKMKDAPVYFTIAQVRFNPILSLKTFMPGVQEQMRKAGYPDFKQSLTVAVNLSLISGAEAQQAPPQLLQTDRYVFSNMENTRGFILQQNSLSFQGTDYDTYETLSSEFLKGLEILNAAVGLNFSERVGIRYLDAVVPKKGDEISQYLVPEVMGIAARLEGSALVHSFSETVARIRDVEKVVCRTIIQIGPLGFPPDLQPDGLKLKDRFKKVNELHAVIDTDGAFEGREPFNIGTVKNRLDGLHREISTAFYATITEYALSVWR